MSNKNNNIDPQKINGRLEQGKAEALFKQNKKVPAAAPKQENQNRHQHQHQNQDRQKSNFC